jgi:hypothetical protein
MKKKNQQLKPLYLAKETIAYLAGSGIYLAVNTIGPSLPESGLAACVPTSINTTV